MSISLLRDRAAEEESDERALEFVRRELGDFDIVRTDVLGGEVVSRAMAALLGDRGALVEHSRDHDTCWIVAEHGRMAGYVHSIEARVRAVQDRPPLAHRNRASHARGRPRGAQARCRRQTPPSSASGARTMLTLRIDLDPESRG